MKISTKRANDILIERHPEPEELEQFPFGGLLHQLYTSKENEGYPAHGKKVLAAMNTLLGNDPDKLLPDRGGDAEEHLLDDVQREIQRHFGKFDADTRALFRVAALYHDIGKYIIKERHPTVGWYTMEYLNPGEKDDLRALLGGREDYRQLLMIMIRDHDEFGVLSTGEASYPILLRAANSLGNNVDDQRQILSAVMWLNLADMAGTDGLELTIDDIKKTISDWRWFLDALEPPKPPEARKERLDEFVIKAASQEDLVEQRICRLLLEASREVPRRYDELRKPSNKGLMVSHLVRELIRTVYPTDIPRQNFASDFTRICKLDYGKRFFASVVEYFEGPPESGEKRLLPKWARERVGTDDLIYAVLAILRRITSTYSAMTRSENGGGNLIGVEMKDLTPRNAPEKTAQIIKLLHDSHYPGLSWMMSDCLAWYF